MKRDIREFFTALSALRISRAGKVALWATVGSMLFISTAQTTAYGLDFPMTTRLTLSDSKNLTVSSNPPAASLASLYPFPKALTSQVCIEMRGHRATGRPARPEGRS